jgi:fluoroquinolone transport system ATP-binding protein
MIKVSGLRFSYSHKEKPILKDLNFSIGQGEIFGFLGPSGAGKSTTQKILIGMLKNYSGSVKVLGKEVSDTGPDVYERIGVAFEFPNFYAKFTVKQNLRLFQSLYSGRTSDIDSLLAQVGLEEAASLRFSELSKGMKMRLNFCRAIMHDPDILFLDEPTSGLDPVNAAKMQDLILRHKERGKTVIITTHNMHAAETLCDRVAFIVDGDIKLIDSPRNLKLRYGERRVRLEFLRDGEIALADFPLEGLGTNEQFAHIIQSYPIETIHSLEGGLEQIFIDVTGRRLD